MRYDRDHPAARTERDCLIEKSTTTNSGTGPEEPPPSYDSVASSETPNVQDPGVSGNTMPVQTGYTLPSVIRCNIIPRDTEEGTLMECCKVLRVFVGVFAAIVAFIWIAVRLITQPDKKVN